MTELVVDVIGWIGAVLILIAYALLTLDRLTARSAVYQGMNVAGSAAFILNSSWHGAMPSAVLNVVWTGIGLFALARILRGMERRPASAGSGSTRKGDER